MRKPSTGVYHKQ